MAGEQRVDSSFVGLVRGLLDDVRELIREEIALARSELREEVRRARRRR